MIDNLRVLIYSNPLVVDKISKRFLFWKDSGFIYTKSLIRSLPSTYRFDWLIPEKIKEEEYEWFNVPDRNINLIKYPYSTSIHQNRYEFYGEVLRKEYPYTTDIDVIINNQPEVSASLRVWANNQRREKPIILSFFHWIDCQRSRQFAQDLGGYFWRQYDGALSSDFNYFHGKYAEDLFLDEIATRSLDIDGIKTKHFFPPPTTFGKVPIDLPDKKIILFNHRLNSTTNWKEIIQATDKLYEKRQDFVLWLTDENSTSTMRKSSLLNKPYIIIKHVPDESYGYLIRNSHFSICNHKGYSTWNMAVLDAIWNGAYTLVPKHEGEVYSSMFPVESQVQYHDGTKLDETMGFLLSTKWTTLQAINSSVNFYITRNIINAGDDIVRTIENEIIARTQTIPKKYEDVADLIQGSNGSITKQNWVNKFWSFHTNSNFQKIRWLLLQSGFKDDVLEKKTSYEYSPWKYV